MLPILALTSQNMVYLFLVLASAVYWVFAFMIFYHLVRFGIGTQPKRLALIFLIGSGVLYCLSVIALFSIDMAALRELLGRFSGSSYNVPLHI